MWSYYRGMCLEYASKDNGCALLKYINQSCHFSSIVFVGCKNIVYKKKLSFPVEDARKSDIVILHELIKKCFEKNDRLKHENEFRYLMNSDDNGDDKFVDCVPLEIEFGCYYKSAHSEQTFAISKI